MLQNRFQAKSSRIFGSFCVSKSKNFLCETVDPKAEKQDSNALKSDLRADTKTSGDKDTKKLRKQPKTEYRIFNRFKSRFCWFRTEAIQNRLFAYINTF
jgi:hypothetical protein